MGAVVTAAAAAAAAAAVNPELDNDFRVYRSVWSVIPSYIVIDWNYR